MATYSFGAVWDHYWETMNVPPAGKWIDEVLALALCVGGIMLARAVEDKTLSNDILKSCRHFAANHEERKTT